MKHEARYKKGDCIGGRYQVYEALLGGMGEVYLCLDLEEMQPFALKTFQSRNLTNLQRLRHAFEHEVATWVALEKHPNIAHCFLVETYDHQPFLILEWIFGDEERGADLRGWLRRGALDGKLALELAIDICRGLQHAQAKQPGIVHCDLKPENILITQKGVAKITDFGLAKIAQSVGLQSAVASESSGERHSLVLNNGIVGTPAYMAPEQWRGAALDVRTDIYALGCILYELLTGVSPFQAEVVATMRQGPQAWLRAMQNAHEHSVVAPLQTFLPKALNELVQRCLAKAPHDRYATPSELMAELVRIYQAHYHQPPPTRPEPGAFTAIDHHNRGLTFAALQQYQAALADFNAVINLGLHDASVYYNRGLTYHALQQQQAALADFNQAIALDPTLADAYANRGVIYATLQQPQAAMADYNRAIALNPAFVIAYSNRGNLHRALQHYQTALADFNQAIQLDPTYATAYVNRGVTYSALGQREEALADYTQAIRLDPNLAQAYYNRGSTYDDLDQREEALADLNQAIQLDPTYASAYLNLGVLLVNQRQLAEALSCFEKAAQLGAPRGAQYAAQVRQWLRLAPAPATDPDQAAFAAFQQANSLTMMQQATARFPLLLQADFTAAIEAWIEQQTSPAQRPAFTQRLTWLRQIANTQYPLFIPIALRLDVAAPNKVVISRPFEIAVAVRHPSSPHLEEVDLPIVSSGDAQVTWPQAEPYLRLHIHVNAPECELTGASNIAFRLYRGQDSAIFYFLLTPKAEGKIGIVITLYQEEDFLSSARIHTLVRKQKAGRVKVEIKSENLYTKPSDYYTVAKERAALEQELAQHQRNLMRLHEQKTIYGRGEEPLHLLNQIEHEDRSIERLRVELARYL